MSAKFQRLTENRQQIARNMFDDFGVVGFLENDHEFVAAEPRHHVARAQRAA